MARHAATLAATVLLAALAPAEAMDPPAPDPFYLDLVARGREARMAGEPSAERLLRIACFGLLEVPPRLADCLVDLALAQAAADDEPGFEATVERVVEIERRFRALTAAREDPGLLPAVRAAAFLAALEARAPDALLAAVPAFEPARIARRAARVEQLDPAERGQALEELMALQPEEPRWRRELAELALASGDAERVLALLASLPAAENACLRSRARAAIDDCAGAMEDGERCGESAAEPVWLGQLRCLTRKGDWRTAADLLARLPPALSARKLERKIARDIRRGLRTLPPPARQATPADEGDAGTETRAGGEGKGEAPPPRANAETPTPQAAEGASRQAVREPPVRVARRGSETPEVANQPALRNAIERSRRRLLKAGTEAEVEAVLANAQHLRASHGDHPELLLHIAEINYRLRRWPETVAAIQASGLALDDRPTFLFYYAVALYESGDRAAAANAIERAWPQLRQTEFVHDYAVKILGHAP